ncbi:MAG: 2-C-methyl-D-erythritol 2,4-cyclodiphosphate synthase [Candidatus Omnitrophica bacterium]|nr:2-C-methyl-D-erythritol 2,4-cyclodiphosphate synthase [Candidatus Omnitrophota bacterium]
MERIGIGYDLHRLVEGRKLILGGLEIPFKKGLMGHSDADVLTHAICDAFLGAIGKGDIGEHFPDTDEQYKGISSMVLLDRVKNLVSEQGFKIANVDTIIIADEPNLKPFKSKIKLSLAQALGLSEDKINVKAKTTEGLGFGSGNQEAIVVHAVVLLKK